MATTWVSFNQIKPDVAIKQVLERYGVHLRRVGGELRGSCPLPTHTSRRSRDSFSVSPARNAWSCRSQSCMQARGGKADGNILDFVAMMEGCFVRDAALRLQDWSGTMPLRRERPGGRDICAGVVQCAAAFCVAVHRPAPPVSGGTRPGRGHDPDVWRGLL
jgi:hypothetical protein